MGERFTRVEDLQTGHQLSVPNARAKDKSRYSKIEDKNHPAEDRFGNPLPPKYRTSLGDNSPAEEGGEG